MYACLSVNLLDQPDCLMKMASLGLRILLSVFIKRNSLYIKFYLKFMPSVGNMLYRHISIIYIITCIMSAKLMAVAIEIFVLYV